MLAAGLVVGLILGICIGARGRVRAALKALMEKMAKAQADAGAGEDDEDDKVDDEDEEKEVEDILETAMSFELEQGLDDHPDTELNPILLYQIRMVKERMRLEKLAAIAAAAEAGEENIIVKKEGKLKLLAEKGALQWLGDQHLQAGGDEQRSAELREKLKTVDGYLSTEQEINVTKIQPHAIPKKRVHAGASKTLTALGKAKDLHFHPFEGEQIQRDAEIADYARRGRSRVGPPLDHLIAASGARRASCGGGMLRRASCGQGGGARRASNEKGSKKAGSSNEDEEADGAVGMLRRASTLIASS